MFRQYLNAQRKQKLPLLSHPPPYILSLQTSHKSQPALKGETIVSSNTDEALKIWNALKPMVDKLIEEKTHSCVRARKMTVTTLPDGSVIGVTDPYSDEIFVPYSSFLSNVQIGDAVWVWYFYGSASTMIALTTGNGQLSPQSPETPGETAVTLNNTTVMSSWATTGGTISGGPYTGTKTLTFNVTGVPDGATPTAAVFTASLSTPYTGVSLLTANGETITTGSQNISLTPTASGNGVYTVQIKFRANGYAGLSDGNHYSTINISDPTLTVTYTA